MDFLPITRAINYVTRGSHRQSTGIDFGDDVQLCLDRMGAHQIGSVLLTPTTLLAGR
jgi:hypothetical protein